MIYKLGSNDTLIINGIEIKDFEEKDFELNIDFSTDKSFVNIEEKENK